MLKKLSLIFVVLFLVSACTQENEVVDIVRKPSLYDIDYDAIADEDIVQTIVVNETVQTFNKTEINRYMYTDLNSTVYPAGMPLIIKEGNKFKLDVINNTHVDTNIHWHGLSLLNDQDGPHLLIDKLGGQFTYEFMPEYTGTYWYHSHNRPVRDQVDFGMHGPLVVLNQSDRQYTFDRILMFDDWAINSYGGHMQIEGDTDTVNGLSGVDIEPIVISNGDFVKLRLIQASSAKNTKINFPFPVRITHTDGILLEEPYEVDSIELTPGERYDVDFQLTFEKDQDFVITNERNEGMRIPIHYQYKGTNSNLVAKDLVPERIDNLVSQIGDVPDIELRMDSQMSRGRGHEWTLNGKIFPNTEKFTLTQGQEYLIRFKNDSRMFNHPMHIHGAHFKMISINGEKPERLTWKDTFNVLPGEYIDVAIRFDNVGEWMLHCHILDHEDGGMMTSLIVEEKDSKFWSLFLTQRVGLLECIELRHSQDHLE